MHALVDGARANRLRLIIAQEHACRRGGSSWSVVADSRRPRTDNNNRKLARTTCLAVSKLRRNQLIGPFAFLVVIFVYSVCVWWCRGPRGACGRLSVAAVMIDEEAQQSCNKLVSLTRPSCCFLLLRLPLFWPAGLTPPNERTTLAALMLCKA